MSAEPVPTRPASPPPPPPSPGRRGVWLVVILLLVAVSASAFGLFAMALFVGGPPSVPSNATLYLTIRAPFPEIEPSDVFSQLVGRQLSLRETTDLIHRARTDRRIAGVVVTVQAPGAMWGQLHEVRLALEELRESGKPVTAFLEYGAAGEYYVASAADRVVMMPGGQLDVMGLATYELFFRTALEKLGVFPDMLQIGPYKTAANVYEETGFTDAHREMSTSLNRDWLDQLVEAVAASRNLDPDAARAALEGGPYTAEGAVGAGLADDIAYEDELDDAPPYEGTRRITSDTYARALPPPGSGSGGRIALLYAVGTIASGPSSYEGLSGLVVGSDTFSGWLRTVRDDSSIDAVVIRVDSPGGSAIASEAIWRAVKLTSEVKPVVVSMGDVAASGGYYIAAAADTIVAEPGTLTGSIGVVMGKFVLEGTMEKLGIGVGVVSEGRLAEIYSPFSEFSDAERARLEQHMQETYALFLSRVAEGRGRSADEIDAVAQGRVWTGRQAHARGLVDELGGLDTAIGLARERAGIDPGRDVRLVVYPPKRSVFEILADPFGTLQAALDARARMHRPSVPMLDTTLAWLRLFRRGEPLALMPNRLVN